MMQDETPKHLTSNLKLVRRFAYDSEYTTHMKYAIYEYTVRVSHRMWRCGGKRKMDVQYVACIYDVSKVYD